MVTRVGSKARNPEGHEKKAFGTRNFPYNPKLKVLLSLGRTGYKFTLSA